MATGLGHVPCPKHDRFKVQGTLPFTGASRATSEHLPPDAYADTQATSTTSSRPMPTARIKRGSAVALSRSWSVSPGRQSAPGS